MVAFDKWEAKNDQSISRRAGKLAKNLRLLFKKHDFLNCEYLDYRVPDIIEPWDTPPPFATQQVDSAHTGYLVYSFQMLVAAMCKRLSPGWPCPWQESPQQLHNWNREDMHIFYIIRFLTRQFLSILPRQTEFSATCNMIDKLFF